MIIFGRGGPVHICAGFSGLAYVVVLGKRKVMHAEHHNMVNVMFGTGVLWFGWFAFNGGSEGAANSRAVMAGMVLTRLIKQLPRTIYSRQCPPFKKKLEAINIHDLEQIFIPQFFWIFL